MVRNMIRFYGEESLALGCSKLNDNMSLVRVNGKVVHLPWR